MPETPGDGREAAQDDDAGLRTGRGPVLMVCGSHSSYGDPESGGEAHLTLWAWPLQPPGPVELTCSWPGYGLTDQGIVIDGGAIHDAALRAQPFWPVAGS